ncbi:MFS transporter [Clostridium felsineum]|uniref:MFS transporter n=1 Tax=Clostridium felsineum TaxID=36839 RepID=UPI00098C92CA|nr:MFS transporter [Clostridium felsineum]URZ01846.1 hypothetical protein CLAUR_018430 [Clostridium felsineum]
MKSINRNIKVSYIYNVLMNFDMTSAIWVLYLSYKGLSLTEIGVIEAIFHVSSVLGEVPTGIVADFLGRKTSVVVGRIMSLISGIIMIFGNSFFMFSLAFVFSALGHNLNSGAEEALIYDTLKKLNKEEEYNKTAGKIAVMMEIGNGLAVFVGGILSDIRFVYAYILSLLVQALSFIVSLFYVEPKEKQKITRNSFFKHIKECGHIFFKNKRVFYLILFSEITATIAATIYYYSQKYFGDMNYMKVMIAVILLLDNVVQAFASKVSYKLEEKLKVKGVLILIPLLYVISLLGLFFFKGGLTIVFFLVCSFSCGITYPIFSNYINGLIPSKNRATILSFQSICYSICMIVVFPAIGFLSDRYGITNAFLFIMFMLIPVIFAGIGIVKENR